MPTFIKIDIAPLTDVEVIALRKRAPSKFVTVTESHAADVLRPQGKYQEVPEPITDVPRASSRK